MRSPLTCDLRWTDVYGYIYLAESPISDDLRVKIAPKRSFFFCKTHRVWCGQVCGKCRNPRYIYIYTLTRKVTYVAAIRQLLVGRCYNGLRLLRKRQKISRDYTMWSSRQWTSVFASMIPNAFIYKIFFFLQLWPILSLKLYGIKIICENNRWHQQNFSSSYIYINVSPEFKLLHPGGIYNEKYFSRSN